MEYLINTNLLGEKLISAKYKVFAENKARYFLSEREENFVKIIPIADQYQGKVVQILIKISVSLPFINISISSEVGKENTTPSFLNSGLSIIELNQIGKFSQFYPKESKQGFIDFSNLYRSNNLETSYNFFKTFNGKNVNQNHYLYGSQFTGEIAKQVQYLLGSNKTNIKYNFDWYKTNGIYIDSRNEYWLITISNSGLFVQKINSNNAQDNTVASLNGISQKPINVNIVNGDNELDGSSSILSLSDFYNSNSFALNPGHGWAFNKRGNKIRNISYQYSNDGNFIIFGYLFEITITENKDKNGNIISISASKQVVENGYFYNHYYLNVLTPKFSEYSANAYPENTSINNYTQAKNSPLIKKYLNTTFDTKLIPDGEYKCALNTYFDNNDNPVVHYYYLKKEFVNQTITSNSGFTSIEDFYVRNWIREGDITIHNSISGNNDLNYKLNHGIMINNDTSSLEVDNFGDDNVYYTMKIDTGSSYDDFNYKVINNLLEVDLRNYQSFDILNNIDDLNGYINDFQNKYNLFDYYFKQTHYGTTTAQQYEIVDYYDVASQMNTINKWLSVNDTSNTFIRLKEVTPLIDIKKLNKYKKIAIDFAPALYKINQNILEVFQNLNSDYFNNANNSIQEANNIFDNNLNANGNYYRDNILLNLKNNFSWLQSFNDFKNINENELKNFLLNVNLNIDNINNIHNDINNYINQINAKVDNLSQLHTYMNVYLDSVENFVSATQNEKGYLGFDLTFKADVVTYYDGITTITDKYYIANKKFNGKFSQEAVIENAKLTNHSFIYNYSTRNALTLYKQKNIKDDLYYDGNLNNNFKYSIMDSNQFALFKRTETYVAGSGEITSTDYVLVDTFLNYKRYTFIDQIGNEVLVVGGYFYLESSDTTLLYNPDSNYGYSVALINQDFGALSKDYTPFNFSNNRYSVVDTDYNTTYETSIDIFADENVNIETSVKNDYRLINFNSSFNALFTNDIYDLPKYGNGLIYFNLTKDVNTFNYTVSKDFYGYFDNKLILTNISKYNILGINHLVNYLGKPFDNN